LVFWSVFPAFKVFFLPILVSTVLLMPILLFQAFSGFHKRFEALLVLIKSIN
jgi:hypothetical protein